MEITCTAARVSDSRVARVSWRPILIGASSGRPAAGYGGHRDLQSRRGRISRRAREGKDASPRSRHLGVPLPTSVESAFAVDLPGEYEIYDVMVTGIRTFRDGVRGAERGTSTAYVYELDGELAAHLGDVGHVLSQETLGEMGHVDIVCLGDRTRPATGSRGELVTQLGANLVVPLPVATDEAEAASDLERFLKEMSVAHPTPVARLNVSISTVPQETAVVVLEPRGRS